MKLELTFPFLFRARPQGARLQKDVYIASRDTYEVPEYGLSEAVKVFEWSNGKYDNYRIKDYLSINGKLYREIGEIGTTVDKNFTNPFASLSDYTRSGVGAIFDGRLRMQRLICGTKNETWWSSRDPQDDSFTVEATLTQFMDIDPASFGEATLTVNRAVSRLVIIDGLLHVESLPPAVHVEYYDTGQKKTAVGLAASVPQLPSPEHYRISRRHFDISDNAGAKSYASELCILQARRSSDFAVVAPTFKRMSDGFLITDDAQDHLRRIAREMAFGCLIAARKYPSLASDLSVDDRDLLSRCASALCAENALLGQSFDIEDAERDLLRLWRHFNRPKLGRSHLLLSPDSMERFLDHVIEETAPVMITDHGRSKNGLRP
jgi:hypothetical protein